MEDDLCHTGLSPSADDGFRCSPIDRRLSSWIGSGCSPIGRRLSSRGGSGCSQMVGVEGGLASEPRLLSEIAFLRIAPDVSAFRSKTAFLRSYIEVCDPGFRISGVRISEFRDSGILQGSAGSKLFDA